jgi:Immunity protein 61
MGPEQLELAAPLPSTIEKYFYGFFGPDVRYYRDLAQATPVDRLPGGFEVGSLADAGQDYLARFDDTNQDYLARFDDTNQDYLALYDAGQVTAVDGFGMVLARIRLSDLAVYLSHDTEEIKASFMARDGAPLLAVTEGEGEGAPAPA